MLTNRILKFFHRGFSERISLTLTFTEVILMFVYFSPKMAQTEKQNVLFNTTLLQLDSLGPLFSKDFTCED